MKVFLQSRVKTVECLDVTTSTGSVKINVKKTVSSIQLEPLNTRPETPLVSEQSCDHCFLPTIPAYFNRNTGTGTCCSCCSCKRNGWISTQTTWTRKTNSVWASCNVYCTVTGAGKNKSVRRLKHRLYRSGQSCNWAFCKLRAVSHHKFTIRHVSDKSVLS